MEDQTPLVDFCNTNNPRAPPADRSIPTSPSIPELALARSPLTSFRPRGPAFLRRRDRSFHPTPGLRPEPGFVSVRHQRHLHQAPSAPGSRPPSRGRGFRLELGRGWLPPRALAGKRPGSCDPERHRCSTDACTPASRGECAASANRGFTGQGPIASAVSSSHGRPPEGMPAQELRPNPIRSDTSCRELASLEMGRPHTPKR